MLWGIAFIERGNAGAMRKALASESKKAPAGTAKQADKMIKIE